MNVATLSKPTCLRALYDAHSKHSSYQLLHPSLLPLMGDPRGLPAGRHEAQRQRCIERSVRLDGLTLLDIGANTGYFSFAAVERGARRVVCQEGNPRHAAFIEIAASRLGVTDRLVVRPEYFDFTSDPGEAFDACLCLNVLHHLGDDFGDPSLTIDEARRRMLAGLNRLARASHTLFLQIGFNWKGDVRYPLFEGGQKGALIDFVVRGAAEFWRIDEITVFDAAAGEFVPLNGVNVARVEALGEFLNRPLFRMSSLLR